MPYSIPAIVKSSERLLVEVEKAVRAFPRFHKYQHGTRLRDQAMQVAQLANRAWRDVAHQAEWLNKLAFAIDDLKLSLQLGKEIQAFASFKQFEALARLASDTGRQCGGWRKQVARTRQNGEKPSASNQRPQVLSSSGASHEAHP